MTDWKKKRWWSIFPFCYIFCHNFLTLKICMPYKHEILSNVCHYADWCCWNDRRSWICWAKVCLAVLYTFFFFPACAQVTSSIINIFLSFYRIFRERVEMLKKKRLELKSAKSAKRSKPSEAVTKESRHEESSSDDESGENFAVDWRAQHLWMLARICYLLNSKPGT